MRSHFMRSIIVLALVLVGFGGTTLAQAPLQKAPCPISPEQIKQGVETIRAQDLGPVHVSLCDGSIYVGSISEIRPHSFALQTGHNQFVQINYTNVKGIGVDRYLRGPSRSEKVGRLIEHYLLLPFTIIQCLLAGCGS